MSLFIDWVPNLFALGFILQANIIEQELRKAKEWMQDTLEQEEHALNELRAFVRQHGLAARKLADSCIEYAKERFEEKRVIVPIQQRKAEREAARCREREAAEAAELARIEAKRAAEEARRMIRQAQLNYETQMRTLRTAQVEAGRTSERVAQESRYRCAQCGTEGIRRPSECPLKTFHYILDVEREKGATAPKTPK